LLPGYRRLSAMVVICGAGREKFEERRYVWRPQLVKLYDPKVTARGERLIKLCKASGFTWIDDLLRGSLRSSASNGVRQYVAVIRAILPRPWFGILSAGLFQEWGRSLWLLTQRPVCLCDWLRAVDRPAKQSRRAWGGATRAQLPQAAPTCLPVRYSARHC
jgi:hypothetical protein